MRKVISETPHFLFTGYDHKALFLVSIPQHGGSLNWHATVPFPSEGQAIALDLNEPGRIYSIIKRDREVIVGDLLFLADK